MWLYRITETLKMLMLSKVIHIIEAFLWPPSCIGCGRREIILCDVCLLLFKKEEHEIIPNTSCVVTWHASYQNPNVKKIVQSLKFKKQKELARMLGRVLCVPENTKTIAIPIPLHPQKLKKRGYNQATLLANETGLPVIEALIRVKHTSPQGHTESREARFKNMEGAFKIKNLERIVDKNIILVDDIITTGATLESAILALQNAGIKKIAAIVLAHG